jgi:hypothetical protein
MSDVRIEENPQFKNLGFEPTEKEINYFNKEKTDMYKGTFMVCLVYGLVSVGLLFIIFFTSWGREYIYNKMLPATVTFIFGALFIIFYLMFSIYDLKPRKLRNKTDQDNQVVCPDYWKLKQVSESEKQDIFTNNRLIGSFMPDLNSSSDNRLKYKCEVDYNANNELSRLKDNTNNIYNGIGYYKNGYKNVNTSKVSPDYLYVEKVDSTDATQSTGRYTDEKLGNYAQFSSIHSINNNTVTLKDNSLINDSNIDANYVTKKKPLICNIVYPGILASLDENTPEKNKYRCEYAKACDITWTDLGCKYENIPASS